MGGSFNVSISIIAPHVGIYNITILGLSGVGPFFPGPVSYLPGKNGWLVKMGNITLDSGYPPLRATGGNTGGVPATQPLEKTVEVKVVGLTLTASSRNMNFTGLAALSATLTYSDIQSGKAWPKAFTVQVIITNSLGTVNVNMQSLARKMMTFCGDEVQHLQTLRGEFRTLKDEVEKKTNPFVNNE